MITALGDAVDSLAGSRSRRRRRLARRDREIADRSRRSSVGLVLHRDDEGGDRPGVRRRVPSCARGRRRAHPRDGLRLLPRPRRHSAAHRGCGRAPISCSDRATRRAGGRRTGVCSTARLRGGCLYAQVLLGMRVRDLTGGFKCFRRRRSRPIDLGTLSAHGYAFQIETTYRVKRAGLRDAGGSDHVRRTARGCVEDDRLDRCRGDVEGSVAPAPRPRGASCRVKEVGAASSSDEVLARTCPSSSTLWRRGAGRATRSSRTCEHLAEEWGEPTRLGPRDVDSSLEFRHVRRPLAPDCDPLRGRGAEGDRVRRAPSSAIRARVRSTPVTALATSWADLLEGEEIAYSGVEPSREATLEPFPDDLDPRSLCSSLRRASRRSSATRPKRGTRHSAARTSSSPRLRDGVGEVARVQPSRPRCDRARSEDPCALPLPDEGARAG